MRRGNILLFILLGSSTAYAEAFDILEDFEDGHSDWLNALSSDVVHHVAGGHDGGAYISSTTDIETTPASPLGSAIVQFRCATTTGQLVAQNCSDGQFKGDYIDMGFAQLRFWFRHDSAIALQGYIRIPTPANTPGASAYVDAPVSPNIWTELVLNIDPANPEFDVRFGGANFDAIFRDVGRLQPGIFFDVGVAYKELGVTFDIDDIRLLGPAVPEMKSSGVRRND